MANIVGGIAVSHGPLLCTPPSIWHLRAGADQKNVNHWYQGRRHNYDELLAARAPGFGMAVQAAHQARAYAQCQSSLDQLADKFKAMRADWVIVVGNDQREVFHDDMSPALLVYTGESIPNIPLTPAQLAKLPPGIAEAEVGHCPPEGAVYPGHAAQATRIVESLSDAGFDVATSARLPSTADGQHGVPHAFGFVYRRILNDAPPPSVPVFVNVGVAPNQVRTGRALAFGAALARAVRDLPDASRVVLIASGGLSHFVVDESLDQKVLQALSPFDAASLQSIPESWFNGNSGEIKSWMAVAAAMNEAGLRIDMRDYTPCYRTPAGTGSGMGFVAWSLSV